MSRHTPYPQDGQPNSAARGPISDDGWKRSVLLAGLLLFLALAYAAARDAHGATYKWVDEKGIIHYSDKMPPDAVNRAPSSSYSEVTGITQTARNFGASLGLAVLGGPWSIISGV